MIEKRNEGLKKDEDGKLKIKMGERELSSFRSKKRGVG